MPLDFKEITTTGDQFELFARELLHAMGYRPIEGPDRGPDGGRDLIVEEKRTGIAGSTTVRWLVSCKHYAHSGKSVGVDDEVNIADRLKHHLCGGFLAFYSTIPSSGLAARLKSMNAEIQTFDSARIERELLGNPACRELAKRFLPVSFQTLAGEEAEPALVYGDRPTLTCEHCGKDLFENPEFSIIVLLSHENAATNKDHYETIYWSCKQRCDRALLAKHRRSGLRDGWKDLSDLCTPIQYVQWLVSLLNKQHRGVTFSSQAFGAIQTLVLAAFPRVARKTTEIEWEKVRLLADVPGFLGGLR